MSRVIQAFAQFFDGSGDPLVKGWLSFLESGSNNAYKNTFADPNLQIPNANPLQLDAEGRCPNIYGTGEYRVILYINDLVDDVEVPGTMIQMFDPVIAQGAITGGGGGGGTGFETWSITTEYDLGEIVTYNQKYYRSLINVNLGLNPAVETGSWEEFEFTPIWNNSIYYSLGAIVKYSSNTYISKANLNLNNRPDIYPDYWRAIATGYFGFESKTADYEILPTERDKIFVLASSVTANHQFDLPAMDATTDGFRVAVYNASTYDLIISPLGTSVIWIDTSGELTIQQGAFVELIYNATIDSWLPFGSVGPILGSQILGTSTKEVAEAYIAVLHNTTIPDNEILSFGTGEDASIYFDSTDEELIIGVATGIPIILSTDQAIQIDIGGSTAWSIDSIGNLVADPTFIPVIQLPNASYLGMGTNDLFKIYSDGTDGFIYTSGSNNLNFYTNGTLVGQFEYTGDFIVVNDALISGSLYVANSGYMYLTHDTSDGYIGSLNSLSFLVSDPLVAALTLDTNLDAYFANDVHVLNDLIISGDVNVSSLTASGAIQYGSLSDGSTTLTASISEINKRCDGIPVIEETSGTIVTTVAPVTAVSINFGLGYADTYAIVEYGCTLAKKNTNPGDLYMYVEKTGTATARLGSPFPTSSPSIYARNLSAGEFIQHFSGTFVMEVSASGTLVLALKVGASITNGEFQSPWLKVTWIKQV